MYQWTDSNFEAVACHCPRWKVETVTPRWPLVVTLHPRITPGRSRPANLAYLTAMGTRYPLRHSQTAAGLRLFKIPAQSAPLTKLVSEVEEMQPNKIVRGCGMRESGRMLAKGA